MSAIKKIINLFPKNKNTQNSQNISSVPDKKFNERQTSNIEEKNTRVLNLGSNLKPLNPGEGISNGEFSTSVSRKKILDRTLDLKMFSRDKLNSGNGQQKTINGVLTLTPKNNITIISRKNLNKNIILAPFEKRENVGKSNEFGKNQFVLGKKEELFSFKKSVLLKEKSNGQFSIDKIKLKNNQNPDSSARETNRFSAKSSLDKLFRFKQGDKAISSSKIIKPTPSIVQKEPLLLNKWRINSRDKIKMNPDSAVVLKKADPPKSSSLDLVRKIFNKYSIGTKVPETATSVDKSKPKFWNKQENSIVKKDQFFSDSTNADRTTESPKINLLNSLINHLENDEDAKKLSENLKAKFQNYQKSDQKVNEIFQTTPDFYKIKKKIGNGCFGEVYLATQVLTGQSVALKIIPKINIKQSDSRKRIEKEVSILQKLNSAPFVIKLFEVFEDQFYVFLAFEYAENGDLGKYFEVKRLFSESRLKSFMHKVFVGMHHVHQQNVIHRDIKLDNLLLDKKMNPKICDFGISSIFVEGVKITDTGGTPAFLAPEVILNEGKICCETDVWSLGVLLFLLTFGQVPFEANDIQSLYNQILSGRFKIKNKDECTPELLDLMQKMLTVEVKERISVKDILQHKWFEGVLQHRSSVGTFFKNKIETANVSFVNYFVQVGFPESFIEQCIQSSQSNHIKACFDLFIQKQTP
jgi:serine/threonine protein kinase